MNKRGATILHNRVPFQMGDSPATAHEIIARNFRDEEVYMQADSHTYFANHWDTLALRTLERGPDGEKAVYSHDPLQVTFSEFEDINEAVEESVEDSPEFEKVEVSFF